MFHHEILPKLSLERSHLKLQVCCLLFNCFENIFNLIYFFFVYSLIDNFLEKLKDKFPANVVRNQKYNLITFFPLVFYQQVNINYYLINFNKYMLYDC